MMVAACAPSPGPPLSLVTAERVLALRGTPAEAAPGDTVAFDALVAAPGGTMAPVLDWSLCHAPRPLTTNDVVSPACLTAGGVDEIAAAPSVSAPLPADACQLFGPELPPSVPGKPDPRPVASDASGGWYQPVRADLGQSQNLGLQRIGCNLSGASVEVAAQFRMQYVANVNPSPDPIALAGANADGQSVAPSAPLTLTVGWPDGTAEPYPVFDVATQTLVPHVEVLRVSWFATAGAFTAEHSGAEPGSNDDQSSNDFTAPASGPVDVWAVVRDDRGGVGWSHARLEVQP
jgi:hypothetical protein